MVIGGGGSQKPGVVGPHPAHPPRWANSKLASTDVTVMDTQVDSFLRGVGDVSLKTLFNDIHFPQTRIWANQQQHFTADFELAEETCKNLSEKFTIDVPDIIPVKIIESMFENIIKQWCTLYGENVKYIIGAIAVSRHGLHEETINEFIDLTERVKGVKIVKLSEVYEVLRVPLNNG